MKITKLFTIAIIAFSCEATLAQNVGIGTSTPNASAKMDITDANRGLLIPRVALTASNAAGPITAPATSLLVYNTATAGVAPNNVTPGFYFWDGAAWQRFETGSNPGPDWRVTGNTGTNAATHFIGTTDAVDFVTRTANTERMRVTSAGNVGIGTNAPGESFSVVKPQGGWQSRFNNSSGVGADVYLAHGAGYGMHIRGWNNNDAVYTLEMYNNTTQTNVFYNSGRVGLGLINNVGVGLATPAAKLHVVNGSIRPQTGNDAVSGIYFTPNPGGGGGDEAFIRHYVEAGENTKLVIGNLNDADDDISLRTGNNLERVQINGNGTVYLNRGVFFDCNDCGGVSNGNYDLTDGAGGNWGDLSIQGRVLSTNSNLHLSPPGGSRVIINSTYRAAGGATGTTGLDIEDGGIRMRKNYMYFQRYRYCNCYGAGSGTYGLGNWDFCAVAQVGFKNNQSATDEDNDIQCAVYPNGAGAGEQTNYDYYYTEQFNTRRAWTMYLEAFEDANGVTCAASCWNLD